MMLPYHHLEEIAFTRHREFLQQARRRRLVNTLRYQPAKRRRLARQVTSWAGTQLIRWGLKMQGQPPASLRAAISSSSEDFYRKEPLVG